MYKYCRYLKTTDLKVPYLFQRHLYDTYRYFSDERKDIQEDEQEFLQRTNLQLAPCMPLSKYSSLHESGRLRALIGPCVLCTTKVLVWKTLERIAGMSAGKPMEIVQNFVGRVRVVD